MSLRPQHEVSAEIADMTDVERAQLHARVQAMPIAAERKVSIHRFILLLGLVNKRKGHKQ